MKVLLISYSFTPAQNPRAYRWTSIARHWAAQGYEVDVVCGPLAPPPGTGSINGVRIHRVPWSGLSGLRDKVKAAGVKVHLDGAPFGQAGARRWLAELSLGLWKALSWPDYACLWYWNARARALALADDLHPDLMISSSLPFTGHLAGLAVKARHPGLPWVVDIGDPLSFGDGEPANNVALYAWLNTRVERKVFAAANAISVTTQGTAARYREIFPASSSKLSVVPPLLSEAFSPSQSDAPSAPANDRVDMVFVGTLYGSLRRPDSLLRLFVKLMAHRGGERLDLHFYGNLASCASSFEPYRHLLGRRIYLHGLVPQPQALAAMRRASVLVNIGNATTYQLPSKVVEYLAMNRPILNLVHTPQDSSTEFFSRFVGVVTLVNDEACEDETRFAEVAGLVFGGPERYADLRDQALLEHGVERIAGSYLAWADASSQSRTGKGATA